MKTVLMLALLPVWMPFAAATAADESEPARAAQLMTEAAAHERMAAELQSLDARSWRDRRWRRVAIRLCHDYAARARRASATYDPATPLPTTSGDDGLPVTAAEYEWRASEYSAQAKALRAEADRTLTMIREGFFDAAQSSGSGPRQRGGLFVSAKERALKDRARAIADRNLLLAKAADDMAKHYRVRARQLATAP